MANKANELLHVYLVLGDNLLKRDAVMKRMRIRLEELGDLSFNSNIFDAQNCEVQQIVDACQTIPFACEKRLVVVNNADKLRSSDLDPLIEYIANPNDTTVLMLVADSLNARSKLLSAVKNSKGASVITCEKPKKSELSKLVQDIAKSHGVKITASAAKRLLDQIGEDTIRIDQSISKLAVMLGGAGIIDDEMVVDNVEKVNEPKPWEFVDAFCERNTAKCMGLLNRMPSVSVYALLGLCVSRLRELICAKGLSSNDSSAQGAIAKELGVPDWRVRRYPEFSRNFSEQSLRDAICSAMSTELKMKSGTDPDAAFVEWILEVLV